MYILTILLTYPESAITLSAMKENPSEKCMRKSEHIYVLHFRSWTSYCVLNIALKWTLHSFNILHDISFFSLLSVISKICTFMHIPNLLCIHFKCSIHFHIRKMCKKRHHYLRIVTVGRKTKHIRSWKQPGKEIEMSRALLKMLKRDDALQRYYVSWMCVIYCDVLCINFNWCIVHSRLSTHIYNAYTHTHSLRPVFLNPMVKRFLNQMMQYPWMRTLI